MHDTYGMTHTVMGLRCPTDTHASRHIHTNCSTGLRWLHMLLTRGSSVHLLNKSRRSCHRICLAAAAAAASTGRGSLVQGALECVSDVSSTCTNADARWLCRCQRTRRHRVPRPGACLWRACACCDASIWLGQRKAEKSREKQGSDHYLGGNCGLRGSRAKSRAHSSGAEPLAGTPS